MKKFFLAAVLLLCVLLSGCASLEPLDSAQLQADLTAYYDNQVYHLDDSEIHLVLSEVPEVLEQTIDSRERTAHLMCKAHPVSEHGLFAREDIWELWYTYDRKAECWTLTDKDYSGTEYELLSDLTRERCAVLLPIPDGQAITLLSVTTDRAAKTATAVYSYQTETAQYGEFGSLTMNAVVRSDFVWQADGGWQYTNSVFTDETNYTALLGCYIGDDGTGMLSVDRFSIGFDLVVFGDLICIENLRYTGGTLTEGTLHIGKISLTAVNDGRDAVIGFSYVRDAGENTISGDGSITITTGEDGNYYAELFLGGFITDSNGAQTDLKRSNIPLAPVKGYEDPKAESQTRPEQQVTEPKSPWVGTWVGYAPEQYGVKVTVTVRLRENGTCTVTGSIDMLGTISRDTTYRVVDDVSQLPTNLIQQVISGAIPTVAVVYDAQNDRLCTCLEAGVYVYLTRQGG